MCFEQINVTCDTKRCSIYNNTNICIDIYTYIYIYLCGYVYDVHECEYMHAYLYFQEHIKFWEETKKSTKPETYLDKLKWEEWELEDPREREREREREIDRKKMEKGSYL